MLRLGLCCTFLEQPIHFRTTTMTHLGKQADRASLLRELILHNIEALDLAIEFCLKNGIGCFRVNSGFCPGITHPEYGYTLSDDLLEKLQKCRGKIRLTFHPDQFVVLNSPREEVVENSIRELEYQAQLAEAIGADVLTIHAGGAYGDKVEALKRLARNIDHLSPRCRDRIALENDDRSYSPSDLLPLCEQLSLPLVYDVHHHRCLPDELSIEEATEKALSTWNREPLFHISSPADEKKPRSHSDLIRPEDVPECWRDIPHLTLEVEAKAKEVAVLKLRGSLERKKWDLV
jgi:UV DNA damage endonuclease